MKNILFLLLLFTFINSNAQDTPDKIVSITGELKSGQIKGGKTITAQVILKIKKGWHINSDHPFDKNLIATQISFRDLKHYIVDQIVFPPAVVMNLDFSEDELSLFENEAIVDIKVKLADDFKDDKLTLNGEVKYQPCNDQACLFPYTKQFTIELK